LSGTQKTELQEMLEAGRMLIFIAFRNEASRQKDSPKTLATNLLGTGRNVELLVEYAIILQEKANFREHATLIF
jgi:hypothetical protein